ncbi:MAG: hypothetical protein K0B02_03860 [DPANN group archaeon]|nr:hypothetical protein [DPANN group archaeon]
MENITLPLLDLPKDDLSKVSVDNFNNNENLIENEFDVSENKEITKNKDILELIMVGSWESVLLELSDDMNPWDIDIVVLSKRFMEFIKKTNKYELDVPVKIFLAAAVLYRMKVDALKIVEDEDVFDSFDDSMIEEIYLPEDETVSSTMINLPGNIMIPPLIVPIKRYPKRNISIDELINALDKAMTIKNRREVKTIFNVDLNSEDMSETIENIFNLILERIDIDNTTTFSSFLDGGNVDHLIKTFSSILHLSNEERISCLQKDFFGEIYISVEDSKLLDGKQNA